MARADRIDDFIEVHRKWMNIPGLSVAVIQNGKIVKAKGYGLANLETKTPATANTVYKIASISKQFLSAAAMTLVQEGKLGLDDKIDKYLNGVPDAWKEISVRQLLTHTSGLARDFADFDPFHVQSDDAELKQLYAVPLTFKPGVKWSYSNPGYYCIARIVAKASGMSWSDYVNCCIFSPLGMKSTRTTTEEVIENRASGYDTRNGKVINAENWLILRPSGAFLSTVLDFAKWDAGLYSEAPLNSASKRQVFSPVALNDGTTHPYGFGWFLDSQNGHKRLHHSGGVPGFTADYERFEDDKLSVVVLTNMGFRDIPELAVQIAGLYLLSLAPKEKPAVPERSPATMARVKSIVANLGHGKAETESVTPALANGLKADLESGFGRTLAGLGPISGIELIEVKTEGDNRNLRYRVKYRYMTLFASVVVGKDGTISRLAISD